MQFLTPGQQGGHRDPATSSLVLSACPGGKKNGSRPTTVAHPVRISVFVTCLSHSLLVASSSLSNPLSPPRVAEKPRSLAAVSWFVRFSDERASIQECRTQQQMKIQTPKSIGHISHVFAGAAAPSDILFAREACDHWGRKEPRYGENSNIYSSSNDSRTSGGDGRGRPGGQVQERD